MSTPQADKFCAANLPSLCREVETWLITGRLPPSSTFNQLTGMMGKPISDPAVVEMAKLTVLLQALRVAAQLPGVHSLLKASHVDTLTKLDGVAKELQGLKRDMAKRDMGPPPQPKPKPNKPPPDKEAALSTEGQEPPSLADTTPTP